MHSISSYDIKGYKIDSSKGENNQMFVVCAQSNNRPTISFTHFSSLIFQNFSNKQDYLNMFSLFLHNNFHAMGFNQNSFQYLSTINSNY